MRRPITLAILLATACTPAPAERAPGAAAAAPLAAEDIAAIRATDSTFAGAVGAGDAAGVAAMYLPDAHLLPPNLGPVEGRTRQIIRTPDGRTLNQAGIGPSFLKEHGVRRWQVRHTAPDTLVVLVVTESPWSAGGREETVNLLGSHLGRAMRIQLVEVEDIPVTSAGKFEAIVPLPEDATARQS